MARQEIFERPKSRRAHRNSTGFVVHEPDLPHERPGTSRGRRSSVPSNYSDSPSPRYSESYPAPAATPRPPSSRRRRSTIGQNQRTHSQDHGISQADRDFYSGSVASSRPSTASSLSRYTPLPSIGTKLDLYDSQNDAEKQLVDKTKHMQISGRGESGSRDNKVKHWDKETESETQSKSHVKQTTLGKTDKLSKKTEKAGLGDSNQVNNVTTKDRDNKITKDKISADSALSQEQSGAIVSFQPSKRKIKLPAEPSENDTHLTLAVKLPSGQRVQRNFDPSNTLQNVIDFAESTAGLDFQGCHLACNIPVKVYTQLSKTLKQSGVQDRTVFHVHIPN